MAPHLKEYRDRQAMQDVGNAVLNESKEAKLNAFLEPALNPDDHTFCGPVIVILDEKGLKIVN